MNENKKTQHFPSLDVMRGIAIILMIQVHFVENMSPWEASTGFLYGISAVLGMVPAPLFGFLTGLSLWIWLRHRESSGVSPVRIRVMAYRRGFFLFTAGLAFAFFIWLPKEVFSWDILTFLGASTLVVYALRRLPVKIIVLIMLAVFLISPPLREMTDYYGHWDWEWEEYIYEFTFPDVMLGFFLHGYFPLFPWIIFPLAGLITGKQYFENPGEGKIGKTLPLTGMVLMVASGVAAVIPAAEIPIVRFYAGSFSFYPASATFLTGSLGLVLLMLWAFNRTLDNRESPSKSPVLLFLQRYSRFSLTTYVVHHAVHVWPLLLAGYIASGGRDHWWFYGDALGTPTALLLALFFIIGFYPLLVLWEKKKQYSFEGFMRWFTET